jgi:hypothetical protein
MLTFPILLALIILVVVPSILTPASVGLARPDLSAPTLHELDMAIARSEFFLEGLYKPIDETGSSVAEYYAFPLRAYFVADDLWRLAGADGTSEVTGSKSTETTESFAVDFHSPRALHSPRLNVEIDWNYTSTQYSARISSTAFEDTHTEVAIYLADSYVGTYSSKTVGQTAWLVFDKTDFRQLQSFRYTVRHGNQAGQNYYWYKQNLDRFEKLVAFQAELGFQLDFDLHAPIWGHGTAYPDDMMFETDGQSLRDAFHDCSTEATTTVLAYAYRSKVCAAGPQAYATVSRFDPLSPSVQALHSLNKYGDPWHMFSTGLNQTESPQSIAASLEEKFDVLGFGVPMCTPAGCNAQLASGVRTFQFGALEARLGYQYGREASRNHADVAARLALKAQIGDDGIVRAATGTYYRPAQRGGFYVSWNSDYAFEDARPLPYQVLDQQLSMPAEYRGVVASNMETAHDAYAFLVLYRCEKYRVGCAPRLEKSSDVPTNQYVPWAADRPAPASQSGWAVGDAGLPRLSAPSHSDRFSDWFADNRHGWPNNPDGVAGIEKGMYRLTARVPGRFVAISAPVTNLPNSYAVSAAFQKVGGPPGCGYGLIIRDQGPEVHDGWNQAGRYYVFEVGDQGELGIWRREETRWVEILPWTASEAVRRDGTTNNLLVTSEGSASMFVVNGQLVAKVTDMVLTAGRVGIFVGGDGNIVDLEHFAIQPTASTVPDVLPPLAAERILRDPSPRAGAPAAQ